MENSPLIANTLGGLVDPENWLRLLFIPCTAQMSFLFSGLLRFFLNYGGLSLDLPLWYGSFLSSTLAVIHSC